MFEWPSPMRLASTGPDPSPRASRYPASGSRTTASFTVSTGARVRADIRPRSQNVGPIVEFVRHFSKGHHTVTLSDGRLKPDRWTLRLQATNSVGSGPITIIDVRVVKHD